MPPATAGTDADDAAAAAAAAAANADTSVGAADGVIDCDAVCDGVPVDVAVAAGVAESDARETLGVCDSGDGVAVAELLAVTVCDADEPNDGDALGGVHDSSTTAPAAPLPDTAPPPVVM
jgi:hypothetical protein